MTRGRALTVLIVVLIASAVFADVRVFQLGGRLSGDEHKTCKIQARGLPASHHLADAMGALSALLTLPTPKPPPAPIRPLLLTLRAASAAYQEIEAKQPQSRKC